MRIMLKNFFNAHDIKLGKVVKYGIMTILLVSIFGLFWWQHSEMERIEFEMKEIEKSVNGFDIDLRIGIAELQDDINNLNKGLSKIDVERYPHIYDIGYGLSLWIKDVDVKKSADEFEYSVGIKGFVINSNAFKLMDIELYTVGSGKYVYIEDTVKIGNVGSRMKKEFRCIVEIDSVYNPEDIDIWFGVNRMNFSLYR